MPHRLTDEEMIRQYYNQQPDLCFDILYKRYLTKIYNKCLTMIKDSEKAQDYTQDIFIKVYNKLAVFQHRSSFSTWLYSIAYNYCTDQIRLARRYPTIALDDQLKQHLSDSSDVAFYEEFMPWVKRAMEKLTTRERTLIQLRYEEGMSIEQIAHVQELTESAVKMRLKRSRDKIYQFVSTREIY